LRESLNMRLKWLPPEHPGVAMALGNLALALWYQGDLAGAEATNRQVLQMRRNLFHDANAETASSLNNLALVLRDRGDFPPAEAMQREALAMVEKALGKDNPHTALARHNLAVLLRRRGAFAGDPVGLREALNLNPTDAMTCDAFANLLAAPALTPVAPGSGTAATGWRYQTTQPDPDWAATGYADAAWPSAPAVFGAATYVPRSANNSIISHTNLWLRRAFELSSVPPGKLVLRINRNQDAQIFLNGVEVVPTADWSDTEVLLPVAGEGQPRCAMGRNVLAVHCQDADGGVPIDVRVYVSQDKSAGRQSLLEELGAMMAKEPGRAELWGGRAGVLARLGRWREAAADLSKAIELKPSEPTGWYLLAPVLLEIGDRPGYELHRHQALARFGQPQGPLAAERIARLALLTPASGAELETAGKLADDAAAVESADGGLPWRQLAEGLAAYRRGSFSNAVAWMRKARATAGRPNLPGWSHEMERNVAAAGFLVEAMASHQMHDGGAARGALDRGIAIVGTQLPPPDSGDLGRDWPNWLAADILLRETKALIQ
jgi:tetratricopeptide (TPR) repeat protein